MSRAMAKRLVKNLTDDYLSCTICLETYKTPKALQCEHAFCEQCLIDHVTKTITRASFQCPVCRNKIRIDERYVCDIPRWVRGLPTDTLLSSLLQTVHVHEIQSQENEYLGLNICTQHGGKVRDVYCFGHAQLICWECAAREHGNCSIDSVTKAGHVIQPTMESLKTQIDKHLKKCREMCKGDKRFTESKTETIASLNKLEKDLDAAFASAKKQILLLREEIEIHNRTHLEQRKGFYDLVTFLLEMNGTLETIKQSEDVASVISVLEKLKEGVQIADEKMAVIESHTDKTISELSFILDDDVDAFLRSYASVGFIDVCDKPQTLSPGGEDAPLSISHILRRETSNINS